MRLSSTDLVKKRNKTKSNVWLRKHKAIWEINQLIKNSKSIDWENRKVIGKSIKKLKSFVGTDVRMTLRFGKTNRWQIRMNLKS